MGRRIVWAALLALGCVANAQTLLYRQSFDTENDGWQLIGRPGTTTVQTAVAHEGGALDVSWQPGEATQPPLLLRLAPSLLGGAQSFRFWLRASHNAIVAFVVAETSGARYVAPFWLPADTWQEIDLSPDRMRLADDTVDPNNQIDFDQVAGLGLIDLTDMLGAVLPDAAAQPRAARHLWLDDFRVGLDASQTAYSARGALPYLLDDFHAGFSTWVPLFGTVTADPELVKLRWTYGPKAPAGGMPAVLTMLGPLPTAGAGQLVLSLRSRVARQVAVFLQEENRPPGTERGFIHLVRLNGGPDEQTLALPLDTFELEEKYRVTQPGPMQLGRINRLFLLDIDVMAGLAATENTIALTEVLLTAAQDDNPQP